MNVELLRKIAAAIQEKPKEFNMECWHYVDTCGTTHCIGGWAQVLTGSPQTENAGNMAAILGIQFVPNEDSIEDGRHADDDCEAGRLLYQEGWPPEFLLCDEGDCPAHPYSSDIDAAVARIEHFIATEGRE